MSYRTVEVELDSGRVRPRGSDTLPTKATALLTILESAGDPPLPDRPSSAAGLRRFLSAPDFPLTPGQFRASMEADFFEQ
jgi:hypothetical protein